MIKFRIVLCFIGFLICFTACSDPESSEPALEELLATDLSRWLKKTDGKGVSVGIILPDGQGITASGGISHDLTKISPDMAFDLGSAGKNLAAALALKLQEEGRINLDDPVGLYLSPLPHVDGNITIRQCLNHTSGLFAVQENPATPNDSGDYGGIDYDHWWTVEEIFTDLMKDPYFPPGTDWHYSQAGYHLLTLVVETVTGNSIAVEIQNKLLNPMGIDGMILDFSQPFPSINAIAHQWVDEDQDGIAEDVFHNSLNWLASLSRILMYSSPLDFSRWLMGLMNGTVLEPQSIEQLLDFHQPCTGESLLAGYGLGTEYFSPALLDGETVYGHGGSIAGYRTIGGFLPDYGFTLTLMVNWNCADEEAAELYVQIMKRIIAVL